MTPASEANPGLGVMGQPSCGDGDYDPEIWALANFGGAEFGHQRKTDRLVAMAAKVALHGSWTTPVQCRTDAEAKAAYRLFNSEVVTHAAVTMTHRERVIGQARVSANPVLFIHDDSLLDFSHRHALEGLGPIGNGHGRGLIAHTCLVSDAATNGILGMAHQDVWARPEDPVTYPANWHDIAVLEQRKWLKKERRRLAKERKIANGGRTEAQVWEETVSAIGACPAGQIWVSVGDRGADVYSHFGQCFSMNWHCLVRLKHDRAIDGGDPILTSVRSLVPMVRHVVTIDGSLDPDTTDGTQTTRTKRKTFVLNVAWEAVSVKRPRGSGAASSVQCHVVRAWNEPKDGEDRVEWVLLSTLPIRCKEEAVERLNWYKRRWVIEDFHKALKTGCKVQRSQIRTLDALLPLIGMCTVVAMRLVQMRDDARANPEQTVEESDETIQVLAVAIGKPAASLRTKCGFLRGVAMPGGFLGRKCDLQPGWLTIARGWYELQVLLRGIEIGRDLANRKLIL
jgi:hypothetical protein